MDKLAGKADKIAIRTCASHKHNLVGENKKEMPASEDAHKEEDGDSRKEDEACLAHHDAPRDVGVG